MRSNATNSAINCGMTAFTTLSNGKPDTADMMYKFQPTGGVNNPSVKLRVIITPK